MLCLCSTYTKAVFVYLCICVYVYLYLGDEGVVVGELVVDALSFQKIFGLSGLKCHIMEIWRDVTLEDDDEQRNVKIELEFWKQNSQYSHINAIAVTAQNFCKILRLKN